MSLGLLRKIAEFRGVMGVFVGLLVAGVLVPLVQDGAGPQAVSAIAPGAVAPPAAGGEGLASSEGSTDAAAAGVDSGADPSGATVGPGGAVTSGSIPTGPDAASVPKRASDQGVTPESIKLGVALIDLAALSATGIGATNGTVEDRQRVWRALVDAANANGGAAGRKIEPYFVSWSGTGDESELTRACGQIARDGKVFAVIADSGWPDTGLLCTTRQHKLPTISFQSVDAVTLTAAGGLAFTSMHSNDRILYNHVVALHEGGYLKGKTIGLVTVSDHKAPDQTSVAGMVVQWHSEKLILRLRDRSHDSADWRDGA